MVLVWWTIPPVMDKPMNSALYRTTAEYADNSTVHGVKYIFEKVWKRLIKWVWTLYLLFVLEIVFYWQVSVGHFGHHCPGSVMFALLPSPHVIWREQGGYNFTQVTIRMCSTKLRTSIHNSGPPCQWQRWASPPSQSASRGWTWQQCRGHWSWTLRHGWSSRPALAGGREQLWIILTHFLKKSCLDFLKILIISLINTSFEGFPLTTVLATLWLT